MIAVPTTPAEPCRRLTGRASPRSPRFSAATRSAVSPLPRPPARAREPRPQRAGGPPSARRVAALLAQFKDLLVVLLLVATAISLALWPSSATPPSLRGDRHLRRRSVQRHLGYVQEARAEAAVAALEKLSPTVRVRSVRGGVRRVVPAVELVVGDLVLLEGRGHGPRRRAGRRVDGAAGGGGGADRREPAGGQGRRCDCGRDGARRPRQTWCGAAQPSPTGTAGRWSRPPAWRRRWAASRPAR